MSKSLKDKLREKLYKKKLERISQDARVIKIEKLEKKLKKTKNEEEKKKLENELNLIDKIEDSVYSKYNYAE